MKNMILILALAAASQVHAQVPVQGPDSLTKPAITDSADFKSGTFKKDQQQPAPRRDSLPMDDRKPKNPPKKR